jgi:hypothetical protein
MAKEKRICDTLSGMKTHIYEWDMRNVPSVDRFTANRPVPEKALLLDLLRGDIHFVEEIFAAAPPDWPRPIMHTRRTGTLTDDQLTKLRKRAGYVQTDYALPLDDLVFFTNPAELRELLTQ